MFGMLVLALSVPPWPADAAGATQTCTAAIAQLKGRIDAIVRTRPAPTFRNAILPLENAIADENDGVAAVTFMRLVSPDAALRDASRRCALDSSQAVASQQARPRLYARVAAAADAASDANASDRALAMRWQHRLERAGGMLTPGRRTEYLSFFGELSTLEDAFANNLAQDRSLQLDPFYLRDNRSEDARKTYYLAYNRRAATANVPLLERAIAVRDRIAHLLGYESWADYRLDGRMAGSVPALQKFLASQHAATAQDAQTQLDALRDAVNDEARRRNATLEPWDVERGRSLLARRQGVDFGAIRRYFQAQHTIDATLGVFGALLGITFAPTEPNDSWAPGVLEYTATDATSGKALGTLYLDVFARDAKPDRTTAITLLPERAGRMPVAAVLAQFPPPNSRNTELDYDQVVDLFRALGRAVPALLASTPYESLDGFPHDFSATQAEMFAELARQPAILARISADPKTGEPMPGALAAALAGVNASTGAVYDTDELALGSIDLQYHSSGPHVDTTSVWKQTAATASAPIYAPDTYPQVANDDLLAGDDAGLYARAWAKVYAPDILSAFALNDPLTPEVGMRYRRDVLEPAGTIPILDELRTFLGRDLQPVVSP